MPENRLATGQTSPYLLQHAHNPVDWYPWGPEALERARSADRPLIVSIGYAACHWCHVMERESFEDAETAALMNEHFVAIKVDREERPDLDAVYMDAAQALTGSGGWPLNAFCTPEGVPFFVGTYFPPEPRGGQPSFRQVLAGIAQAWSERRDELLEQGSRVVRAISGTSTMEPSAGELDESVLTDALVPLRASFDAEWGGFGGAPKFPQPMTLDYLLRMRLRGHEQAGEMAGRTLERMATGGIYDQVAGGFARYSVDRRWHVPHFEKMLYDNAQLARTYLHAWQLDGEEDFRRVTRETLAYLMGELRGPEGGFLSSQDADSQGREGAFAVWTWDELVGAVGEDVAVTFGATPEGNWAPEGVPDGTNVLWRPLLSDPPADDAALQQARAILLEVRRRRVRPETDDKVLAAWNGLAITALAEAGTALEEPGYLEAAVRAGEFVLGELRDERGGLARSWRDGRVSGPGYADDHALVAEACLALYEATYDVRWFRDARELCDALLDRFADAEHGGFFQAGSGAEALVVRPKELLDNATPSGNSVAADVLRRMALLTGEARYEEAATAALRLVREHMVRAPSAFGRALCALDLSVSRPPEIAIVGDPAAESTREMVRVVTGSFRPNRVLAVAGPGDEEAREVVPLLQGRAGEAGRATAYVCERFACKLPVHEPGALAAQLEGNG